MSRSSSTTPPVVTCFAAGAQGVLRIHNSSPASAALKAGRRLHTVYAGQPLCRWLPHADADGADADADGGGRYQLLQQALPFVLHLLPSSRFLRVEEVDMLLLLRAAAGASLLYTN
jgi:hypothetical protein